MAESTSYFQGEKVDARLIKKLIDQTENFDPDERYMGISDLGTLMSQYDVISAFGAYQESIQQAILKRLDDISNDVQSMACRTITTLIEKFQPDQVKKIAEKLVSLSTSSQKPEMRSVYAIGLETCVRSLSDEKLGNEIADCIAVPKLLKALTRQMETDDSKDEDEWLRIEREKKRVLLELLKLFLEINGPYLENRWNETLNCLLIHLASEDDDIRNKTMTVMGALVACVPDEIFERVMKYTIKSLTQKERANQRNETIRLISIISRQAGVRIGEYLEEVIPILMQFCHKEEKLGSDIEVCLQAFETMFLRCPSRLDNQVDDMVGLCLSLMTWDPHYSYQMDEDMVEETGINADEDDEWGDEGDDAWAEEGDEDDGLVILEMGQDDTENTWKVRRSALRCLQAFMETRPQDRKRYFEQILVSLQDHFKERDDRVKAELFITAQKLVRTCAMELNSTVTPGAIAVPSFQPHATLQSFLTKHIKNFTTDVVSQLGSTKVASTKIEIVILLKVLCVVTTARDKSQDAMDAQVSGISSHFAELIPQLQECMSDKDIRLKQETLDLIQKLILLHEPKHIEDFSEAFAQRIIDALKEQANSILVASMNTTRIFFSVLHQCKPFDNPQLQSGVITTLYKPIAAQLQVQDIDRIAKAASIRAGSMAIKSFADVLADKVDDYLSVVTDRLENDVAIIPSLQSLRELCGSPLNVYMQAYIPQIMKIITDFLKKQTHNLRHESAETLNSLVQKAKTQTSISSISEILNVVQTSNLIKDEDCRLSELLFQLFETILVNVSNANQEAVFNGLFKLMLTEQVGTFLQSTLVRGNVLDRLISFLRELQQRGTENQYETLKKFFLNVLNPKLSDQSFVAVSQCITVIALCMNNSFVCNTVNEFAQSINSSDSLNIRISLLCVGQIGCQRSLASHVGIEQKVLDAFRHPSERVKSTAARALGLLATGDIGKYIPFILSKLQKDTPLEYLLLNSLRETIAEGTKDPDKEKILGQHIDQMCPLLFECADSKDEGVRTVVGECLGRLAFIPHSSVFDGLQKRIQPSAEGEYIRSTMATAIKFAVQTQRQMPSEIIQTLFSCLQNEPDILPRRSLMLCFNTIANTKRELLEPRIEELIGQVYPYCETNQDLIKQFELGPFKHKVDNGLPLRKATFQVMESLQRVYPHRLKITDFCHNLRFGFNDGNEDVQMVAFSILSQLAESQPQQIVPCLNGLKDNMLAGVKNKLKMAKSNGADAERAKDVLKVIVKSLYTVMQVEGVEAAQTFVTLYKRVAKTKLLADMIKEITADPPGH